MCGKKLMGNFENSITKKKKEKNCDFMPSEKEYEIEQKISGRGWMLC